MFRYPLERLALASFSAAVAQNLLALEVFFDFLILIGDVRMGWSTSAVGHHCRESLVFLANRVHEASRSLIPPLAREMMMIIFLATSDSRVRRTLFDL